MQIPDHLHNTYLNYKAEEQSLLSWICDTARTSGHNFKAKQNLGATPKNSSQSTATKLKGRARTLARRAAQTTADTQPAASPQSSSKSQIAIFDILPPLRSIAANPYSTIPYAMVEKLRAVLELRRKCVSWFKSNTPEEDDETRRRNYNHEYPVRVLESAMTIVEQILLKPSLNETQAKTTTPGHTLKPGVVSDLSNTIQSLCFEDGLTGGQKHLEAIKEIDEAGVGTEASSSNRLSDEDRAQEEYNFAKFCLLYDVQQLEDFLVLELVRYSLDRSNSDVLPFLVDTALDMVQKMDASSTSSFEDATKFEAGFVEVFRAQSADDFYPSPYLRMQMVVSKMLHTNAGSTDVPAECYDTTFDPSIDYFRLSGRDRYFVEQSWLACALQKVKRTDGTRFGVLTVSSTNRVLDSIFAQPSSSHGICLVPVSYTLALRLLLLAAIILKDDVSFPFHALSEEFEKQITMETERAKFWTSKEYCSQRAAAWWPRRVQCLVEDWERVRPLNKRAIKGPLTGLLEISPFTCCLSRERLSTDYAAASVSAMETSGIFRVLAHLHNLLVEEKVLDMCWADKDFLVEAMGEAYVYYITRPLLSQGDAFRTQIFWGIGLNEVEAVKLFFAPPDSGGGELVSRLKPRFHRSTTPLHMLSMLRYGRANLNGDIAVDLELVATATVVPKLIGRTPKKVRMTVNCQLEDRAELFRIKDKGPGLQPVDLLSVVKRGIDQELRMNKFDYLELEKACTQLVRSLLQEFDDLKASPFGRFLMPHTIEQANSLILNIITLIGDKDPNAQSLYRKNLEKAAKVFTTWIQQYGSVGVADKNSPKDCGHLSALSLDIVQEVERIVDRHGLLNDVFLPEQIQGMEASIKVTDSLEARIAKLWAEHKEARKNR